jgi:uncharacterized protein (TIGR00369 family)
MKRALTWAEVMEPFIEHLGVSEPAFEEGRGEVVLQLEPRLTNRFEMAHGGVLMTLLDFVMAQACRSADEQRRPAITIEVKSTFLRPGRGTLRCTGQCVHHARSLAFGEARVLDAEGNLVALASGTFKYAQPAGERS